MISVPLQHGLFLDHSFVSLPGVVNKNGFPSDYPSFIAISQMMFPNTVDLMTKWLNSCELCSFDFGEPAE